MKPYLYVFLMLFPVLLQADEVDCENPSNTLEMNSCIGKEVAAAEAELQTYMDKALERYADDAAVSELMVESQNAWLAFRNVHCEATHEMWSGGSIRGVMLGGCLRDVTRQRTHQVWQTYLTYMDSTPPLLPEPE